eukprot:gnl/Chilomastix_caulleri/1420.p2 GENE.gnl/Chilomastix_caulleri/1420~~gnl/Chilomastix_caulleri/1420.p2  ORF type:complete len:128 (+),score=40.12 gnl/Chilomastix_caulleri/1420:555-938(+)
MYARGGSGFLGAVLFDGETRGALIKMGDGTEIEPVVKIYSENNYYLSESKVNEVLFGFEFYYDFEKYGQSPTMVLDMTNLVFTSLYAGFWDFMPIGPGGSFGIAESNKYIDRSVIPDGDYSEYICHV